MSDQPRITINPSSGSLSPAPSARSASQDSTDPGEHVAMPPPDGGSTDPSDHGGYGAGGASGPDTSCAGGVTINIGSCGCAAAAAPAPAEAAGSANLPYGVQPGDLSGFVIVRLHEGVVGESPAETLWALAELHTPKLTGLQEVLKIGLAAPLPDAASPKEPPVAEPAGVLRSRPLVELQVPGDRCGAALARGECLLLLRELESKAATSVFKPLHSLTAYWRLDLRTRPDLLDQAVTGLSRLAEVDLAYPELRANDPKVSDSEGGQDFAEDQGYLDDAPIGIGASWIWQRLAGTQKVTAICDLEQGWDLVHQDLASLKQLLPTYGANRATDQLAPGDHGTAVLGQLAAAGSSSQGVKGADPLLGQFHITSHYRGKGAPFFPGTNGHVASAIVQTLLPVATPPLHPGDVLLLEVQRGFLPTEVDAANFDAIRLATALRVIVVEAAGNGAFDLDQWREPLTGRSLRRGDSGFRDSGAIFVGAARASLPHDRISFSNYGSRLDCYSWGEAVTTCGFGDLAGTGAIDFYTNRFEGTSSASPVIAGAAALLQSLVEAESSARLEPWEMRRILNDPTTGTPQGPNVPGRIGVMPDLKSIVRDGLQLAPHLYMRRSTCDDGSLLTGSAELSSSPDILLWNSRGAALHFRKRGLRENQPAPGRPVQVVNSLRVQPVNSLYVRLRNRGVGQGDADVRLFASPASTLITPERWIPIGCLAAKQVPQGDQLTVVGPLLWRPGSIDPYWSFLAVLSHPGDDLPAPLGPPYFDWARGLPPGGRYFDWAEFRAFLRQPGVAWRNTHRVSTAPSVSLEFGIAGTPDQARVFDFEILQRLPEGTQASLTVPPALEAKLRQNTKGPNAGTGPLALPARPASTFHQIRLAAGTNAKATLTVDASKSTLPLAAGHSLAFRQLWRDEEVGRITWYFDLAP